MSRCSAEGMSGSYAFPNNSTSTSSSSNETAIPQDPPPIYGLLEAPHNSTSASPAEPAIVCPVPICSLVFKGEMPYGYLWRHLNHPGIHGRTGDEKAAWLHLHKIERDRLLPTRVTPSQRKREANRVKAQKMLRTAEFEFRARDMGITERALVDQKVAIWEGICAAEESGDSIEYCAWTLMDLCTTPEDIPKVQISLHAHD